MFWGSPDLHPYPLVRDTERILLSSSKKKKNITSFLKDKSHKEVTEQ
jgi:hypothetical protein